MFTFNKRIIISIGVVVLVLLASCNTGPAENNPNAPPAGPAPEGDYGDAPDGGPTGYPAEFAQQGNFPTLFSSNGARVLDTEVAWLGASASAETDADDPADPDGITNLTNTDSDDGLTNVFIRLVAIPPPTTMTVIVSAPEGSKGGTFYLNALIDLNMDGEWGGRGANGELEWVVQNQPVQVSPGVETPFTPPAFAFSNGNLVPDGAFMRVALTKEMVPSNWEGTGEFSAGEIEDHFIELPDFDGGGDDDDDDDDDGDGKRALLLKVNCGGPYRPGELVTCTITNNSPFGGSFKYTLRHQGPGSVKVPIGTCNPQPPIQIAAGQTIAITCNSAPGPEPDTPDTWRMIASTVDPLAIVVHGGIILGHSEESISDYDFDGNSKPLNVFVGRVAGSYTHFSGYSMVNVDFAVYGNDPIPMENATVTMQITHPGGRTESLSAVTGPDGTGRLEFTINVYGTYPVVIESIVGEDMIYAPELNVASELEVVVTGGTSVPVGPEGLPDPGVSYDVKSFVEDFNTAFAEGDIARLLELLNPTVIEHYGEAACTTYLESVIENTIQVEAINVLSFGSWEWDIDDLQTEMDNVYSILVKVTVQGASSEQEIHYAQLENGKLSWFTDCGDPLP